MMPALFKVANKVGASMVPANKLSVSDVTEIKKHEGLRLTAYMPTANDVWTIGYGHTKTAKKGMVITEKEAEVLLKQDLQWAVEAVRKAVGEVQVTQNMFDAMVSLCFNIGAAGFTTSSVVRFLKKGDYYGAADSFRLWNKQRNKKTGVLEELRGLTIRREAERELFLRGYNGVGR